MHSIDLCFAALVLNTRVSNFGEMGADWVDRNVRRQPLRNVAHIPIAAASRMLATATTPNLRTALDLRDWR